MGISALVTGVILGLLFFGIGLSMDSFYTNAPPGMNIIEIAFMLAGLCCFVLGAIVDD